MSRKVSHEARRRMTAAQLNQALDTLGISVDALALGPGANQSRLRRWLSGEDPDIPPYVPLVTGLLTLPGAPELAARIAEEFTQPQGPV